MTDTAERADRIANIVVQLAQLAHMFQGDPQGFIDACRVEIFKRPILSDEELALLYALQRCADARKQFLL